MYECATAHAPASEETRLASLSILRGSKHRLTQSSFAKNFNIAGRKEDVFEKNYTLLTAIKDIILAFDVCQPSSAGSLYLE